MTTQIIEAKKVFVAVDNSAQWIVFGNEMEQGFTYQLATIEDLHDYVAATGEYFTQPIETAQGITQWHMEESPQYLTMDYICEYRVIN